MSFLAGVIASAMKRGAAFDPASVFGVSDQGIAFDFYDEANLFQLSNGTTPITTSGERAGYATDLSGKNHPAFQATAANRPYWTGIPRTLGTELCPALSSFSLPAGWSEAGGILTKAAGSANASSATVTIEAGKTYFIVVNMTRSAGTLTARFTGGTTISGASRNASGSYVEILTAQTGNTTFEVSADAAFAGTVFRATIKEVTSFSDRGLFFYGNPIQLATAAINCTASDKATIIASVKQDSATGSQNLLIFGAYGSVAGSILCDLSTQPAVRLWGTTGAVAHVPTAERGSGIASREYVNVYNVDIAGATIAEQVEVRTRGVLPTQTTSGSTNGGTALANAAFRVGANSFRGLIHRVLFINRALSDSERDQVQTWAMNGKVFAAVLGDSTVGITGSPLPNTQKVSDFVGGLVCNAADVSESGSRIADQLGYWNAITDRSKLQVVIVQIGLNDVKGRVGANTATSAQVIADYQALIDDINADKPAGCKVYVSAMTPCKVWLDAATFPAAAYAAWQELNEAIAGNGDTPITGVDGRITAHVALLSDGADNLAAIYDHNLDGVHESNEAKMIVAQAWRVALEADGIL